ncbi:MAG: cobalamin-dependent protein [Rhodobacteraceae bacterium]|nr:cobalamin-dependent protein [Paracoccaceae bacterium]
MGQSLPVIDAEAFARTAKLFAEKRSTLAPEAVRTLAGVIVDRLARAAQGMPRFEGVEVADDSIAAFCDALVQAEPDAALRFMEERRAEGMTRYGMYLGYIAAAARALGERWERNQLSLEGVTIGTGHLYALMRALRAEALSERPVFDARRCALFAAVPGEQHGLGITMAADLFREAGWDIDLQVETDHDSLIARVERTRPPVIGLSLSTEKRLEDLVRLVVSLRIVAPHVLIGVAPTGSLDGNRVSRLVDIDLLFGDAPSACTDLERLIRLRG